MSKDQLQISRTFSQVGADNVTVRLGDRGTPSLSTTMTEDEFFSLVKEFKKSIKGEKVKKPNNVPVSRTQTLTPVKFKKIKKGKTYRLTEKTSGTIVEFVTTNGAEKVSSYPTHSIYYISGSSEYLEYYSDDVKSVHLVTYSDVV